MPWFARKSDRELLRWTVGLLAVPTVLYLAAVGVWALAGSSGGGAASGPTMPPQILAILEGIGTGGFRDAFVGNLVTLLGRWADLFASMRFPKVLGMFVLGLWTVRTG